MAKALVTGGAGFIGSNLVKDLLRRGYEVTALDNLSNGHESFLESLPSGNGFRLVKGDLLDPGTVMEVTRGVDVVFHMAANSDISLGRCKTDLDLQQGTMATYHVLEAMRREQIQDLIFASTSAVYGETEQMPTREDHGPLFPISLYGASKLACEGLISAFVHNYGLRAWVYRFGNVVGRNDTHGVVVDFIHKLKRDPLHLEILGDGKQTKPYVHVSDCVAGMLWGYQVAHDSLNYFNLTCQGVTSVHRIADIVVRVMGLKGVKYIYAGGSRGWPGDVPKVCLGPSKLAALGWTASFTSDEAVEKAAQELVEQLV